MKHYLHYRFKH